MPSRSQASLVFSAGDGDRYIVNATPDVTHQMLRWPELHPRHGTRHTPVKGVLLTDAELDHTLGLLHLREGERWSLYATDGILDCMRAGFDVLPSLHRYADVGVVAVDPEAGIRVGSEGAGVRVRWIETGREPPLYTGGSPSEVPYAVAALVLTDEATDRSLVYAPGVPGPDETLDAACREADVVLFDGTFWTGDEMAPVSGGPRDAFDMGHWPVGGERGSAAYLASLPARVKRYVHINNTNPILDPNSPQRAHLRGVGLDVAEDGEEFEL